ncbi:MAG TPA: plastocyanin/azurin family copper-binding protein [Acidimicrobiales bacterium]|jgi:plastocyanin|nr:plastocyanin/azurin family copper-binding protein [Acidimicrobiales bacterium]
MSPRRRLALLLLALVALVVPAACGSNGSDGSQAAAAGADERRASADGAEADAGEMGASGSATVAVKPATFEPSTISVKVGDTVTWRFGGGLNHNVVADDFKSAIKRSGTFSHRFEEAGTFAYRCTLHPGMKGVVKVS